MKQLNILFGIMLCVFLVSCGTDGAPEVRLTSPSSGQAFIPGPTIVVNGVVTDDTDIDKLFVRMENIYDEFELQINGTRPFIQVDLAGIELIVPDDTTPGDYKITVRAVDTEGLSGEDSVTIKVEE